MTARRSFVFAWLLLTICCLRVAGTSTASCDHGEGPGYVTYEAPERLSYDELVEISNRAEPPDSLQPKIHALLTTPIISNQAYYSGATDEITRSEKLGDFIRIGQWNIQRGTGLDNIKLALENPDEFIRRIKVKPDTADYRVILEQLQVLRRVDVLVLNEVDLGIKRSGYKDVAKEMAAALKMNYVYGVEFIEVDPVNLGTEEFAGVSVERRALLKQSIEVNRDLYRGLHGTAVLSRFPIKSARLIPLTYQPYDWYKEERDNPSIAESARREISRLAFREQTIRQVRFGGRSVLIVELDVPQIPEGAITVVATHLENRCEPEARVRQMNEALSLIRNIKGPVVLAGDFNTSGTNLMPTSIRSEIIRRIKNKAFWIKRLIKAVVPLGPGLDLAIEAASFYRSAHDPTSKGFFIFGPNKEEGLFKELEQLRFDDGYAFDFRGDSDRTINGTKGTLANSNQRARRKGFITTHAMARTYWAVGKNKLDWILVKAYAKDPKGAGEPYRLAPHFPRTLEELNKSLGHKLSDHNPITVDLPIEEPKRWEK